jgi:hypothetical protein
MFEASWSTPATNVSRAKRLLECGFDCFESADNPSVEELRYAEYEFQLYSMHAKWLAQRRDGEIVRAPSQQVCIDLQALTANLRLGEAWNKDWEACLDRWKDPADPHAPYVCPVVIEGYDPRSRVPSEHTVPGKRGRENMWTITQEDKQKYFFVRDFSGMFSIASDDPAYGADAGYTPPAGIFREDWLFEPKSFMQVFPYKKMLGVATQPWRACELLPGLLGADAARIRSDAQWRSLFRVVSALAVVECDGFFDRLQGYDAVNMSLPLFHYTLTRGEHKALQAELGGLLIWLERCDPALAGRMAAAGLSAYKADPSQAGAEKGYKETHWADDEGWGARYEAGSGAGCNDKARVVGSVSIGAGAIDRNADMAFLRRPHFHYRVTMLMRTMPALRRALWKLAIHRMRNLAWMRVKDLPAKLNSRQVLGEVLTSELAMAIVVRLHVWEPNAMWGSYVLRAIKRAWTEAEKRNPHGTEHELQQHFEYLFCQEFFNGSIEHRDGKWTDRYPESNLAKLPAWPLAPNAGFGTRLRQSHLEGNGQANPTDPQPTPLSWLPWTSPFWKAVHQGEPVFVDPVGGLDLKLDFAGDGHPAVPMRYPVIDPKQDFSELGTQVRLPAGFSKVNVQPQRIREALAIRAAAYVLVDGTLKQNGQKLERRPHGAGAQFWARRHIGDMRRAKVASALRCALTSAAPRPEEALWAMDGAPAASTVHAFDWRGGLPPSGAGGEAFAKVGAGGRIASVGDRLALANPGNFGAFVLPLQLKTFQAFALALGKGAGVTHVDGFRVEPGAKGWTLTLAGLRQYFPVRGEQPAAASEWGLMIEYLAWRHAEIKPDSDGWYGGPFNMMRDLGFDAWVPEPAADNPAFLGQRWPAQARGPLPQRKGKPRPGPGPLDPLTLSSAPHLWHAPAPLRPSSGGELAAAMLTWPSLYRMRRMIQDSEQARRAVYDLWRMGMRAALSLPALMLNPVFGKDLPHAYQLFQAMESVAALAYWRYIDSTGLADALRLDTGPIATKAKVWFDTDPERKKFRSWTYFDEHAFLWDVVVPAIPQQASREALQLLKPPLPGTPRTYVETLDAVIDLDGLDSAAPPIPQVDYQAVLLRQPAANVGLGLLAKTAPAGAGGETLHALAAAPAADGFWVGGIVPVLKVAGGFKAVPLMLPQPALVRLSQGPAETVKVGTYWARDGVEEVLDFAALDISEPFTIEADVSNWLGELAQDVSLTLLATASAPSEGEFALSLGLRLASPWLPKPLEWSRQVVDISGIEIDDVVGGKELVWRLPLADMADRAALPVGLDDDAALELALGLRNGAVTARLSLHAATLTIGLGSPVASLRLESVGPKLGFEADLMAGTALVSYPDSFAAYLALELAALPGVGETVARIVPTEGKDLVKGIRIPPFDILLGRFGAAGAIAPLAARPGIDLSDLSRPRIPAWLFEGGAIAHHKAPRCRLLDIAASWLEGAAEALGAFLSVRQPPAIARDGDRLVLSMPVLLDVAGMTAETTLEASCAVDEQGYLVLRGDSFACALSKVKLTMDGGAPLALGSVARLTLPRKLEAMLTLDGSDPGSCFRLLVPKEGEHPVLTVPASGGIRFDIGEFALGSGGLTLAAKVAKDVAMLDLPVLDKELVVQEPKDGIGEFRIVRGRLVSASLQAKVRLKVFDDAEGILTMRIVQGSAGGLTIMAELDVGVAKTFHLRALYLQVIVASVNLSLSYETNGSWTAKGGLTGSMKFAPEGPMAGRLEEYKSLFDGTSVHFEKMDLAQLGESPITVMVTPRTFDVGSMFAVTWRGFVLQRPGDLQAFMGVRLLGDIVFKQRLPKMRATLTLGDIAIRQLRADSLIPKISISSIGVDIGISGGFAFKGRITEFDDAYEYGFGGEVELRSEAFPPTQAMIKLTRLKADASAPSIAVYAATERNDSLGYGFFLRRVGIGVGIRQGLRGFSDEPGQPTATNVATRVERVLKDSRGFPYPAHASSWQPLIPGQRPEYVLVAYMLVTFGLLKPDVDHPLAASAVLAIDDNLDIILGINGWFVTSPENTGNDEYIAHPAIKGALALSPREQVLYGRFMTLPGSKFGPTAEANSMTLMLRKALDAVRLSVAMYADPRGALIEVGWPRNARFETTLGPVRGWAEAGFRFGFYRGTQVVGLNLAMQAEVGGSFSADLGFANVSLSVLARFQLQATFAGAVTTAGQYYVLADVMLSALLEISARAYKRIHISGWGFSFTVTLFDVSVTIGITATAVLQAAIVPSGLGFNGSVEVHIRVAGFGIGARVRIGASEGRVDEARNTIAALVPPIEDLIKAGSRSPAGNAQPPALAGEAFGNALLASAPLATSSAPLPSHWRCHVVRVSPEELRVVLFPDAEGAFDPVGYPPQASAAEGPVPFAPRKHTLRLNPAAAQAFNGMVGSAAGPARPAPGEELELTLVEAADEILLPHAWLLRQSPDAPRAVYAGDLLADVAVETPMPSQEVVDPRTVQPVAGDFDDPAVLADPTRRSTRFRKRYGHGGALTYDDHVQRATETERNQAPAVAGGTSSGELLMQLLNMARDASVRPGVPVEVPAPEATSYDRHLLASRLGLVLSFVRTEQLETAMAEHGLSAILATGKPYPVMFGRQTRAADWSGEASRRARFQIVPGYAFQGKGEVGLVWSVLRTGSDGVVASEGPANHAGIAAFRIQRLRDDRSELPPSTTTQVIPSWVKYVRDGTAYYLRPQFQFHDSSLPPAGSAQLEYMVEALADDDSDTVLASQVIRVAYDAPSDRFSLVHAQALLRLPPEGAAAPAPYRIELLLQVDADTRDRPQAAWEPTPENRAKLASRIQLFRRQLAPGVLGRYGQGHEGRVSVSWQEEDKASGIALPDVDQARQLSIADVDIKADEIRLAWQVDHIEGAAKADVTATDLGSGVTGKGVALACRTSFEIGVASEQADWDRLLGAGCNAAELHVRLAPDRGGPGVAPELGTALLRCRIAITRGSADVDARAEANVQPIEGTEVAALERLPLAAALERQPEWLHGSRSTFRAEVAPRPFVTGGRTDDVGLRLRGVVNHLREGAHSYGAVVGYRVWALDRLDDAPVRRATTLADFLVEPEALYRATPLAVTVRQLAGGAPGQPNWQFEDGPLRMPPLSSPLPAPVPAGDIFGTCRLHGGNQASLHTALIALADDLSRSRYQAQLHADEPMWPAVSALDERLEGLVKRNPPASDAFGWRLLEALGGCATLWVALDDDRIGIEDWEATLAAHRADVVALSFSRLRPGERPDRNPLTLYGVRVFARAMLAELLALDRSEQAVAQWLTQDASQLAQALRLLAPPAKTGALDSADIPKAWIDHVEALRARVGGFVTVPDQNHAECLRAAMWELARVPAAGPGGRVDPDGTAGGQAQNPAVLPALEGRVHVFHTMENGYARELDVAVEVVRRYDIVAPRAARVMPAGTWHEVPVLRTQALEAERWAVSPDPDTGALRALVAVHSAQRLVLYRSELAARVQFIEQKVGLQRAVAAAASAGWDGLFEALGPGLDREAYRDSWVEGDPPGVPPLSAWTLVDDTAEREVNRGYDAYRYTDVAPFYEHGVFVTTQAGVRHSAEAGIDEPAMNEARPAMVEAMFTDRGGLSYPAPQMEWALADDGATLRFEFPLVRGVDALRPHVVAHWTARDQLWQVGGDGPDLEVPVLQLPDLRAQYSLVATSRPDDGPPLRVELMQLEHGGGQVSARVLVGPDAGSGQVEARLVQASGLGLEGRIGMACTLSLAQAELGWLRTALLRETANWSLGIEVQRGGIRYRS